MHMCASNGILKSSIAPHVIVLHLPIPLCVFVTAVVSTKEIEQAFFLPHFCWCLPSDASLSSAWNFSWQARMNERCVLHRHARYVQFLRFSLSFFPLYVSAVTDDGAETEPSGLSATRGYRENHPRQPGARLDAANINRRLSHLLKCHHQQK